MKSLIRECRVRAAGRRRRNGRAGAQTCNHGFERINGEGIGVLARGKAIAKPHDRDAVDRGEHDPEQHVRPGAGGERPGIDRCLNQRVHLQANRTQESEPCQPLADPRHRSVQEHQGEVLGVRLAELVHPHERLPDAVERIDLGTGGRPLQGCLTDQKAKTLFSQCEEDVVLAREVPVDCSRAVFDPLGNLPHRDVLIALRDEQIARGIENCSGNCFPVPFLTFFQTQSASTLQLR